MMTPIPSLWQRSTNSRNSSGEPEPAGRREQPDRLIAPRAVERILAHRHELDVGEAKIANIGDQLVGQLTIGEITAALIEAAPPRSEMNLVDGDRRVTRRDRRSARQPSGVSPAVSGKIVDNRGGRRRLLGTKPKGSALSAIILPEAALISYL